MIPAGATEEYQAGQHPNFPFNLDDGPGFQQYQPTSSSYLASSYNLSHTPTSYAQQF